MHANYASTLKGAKQFAWTKNALMMLNMQIGSILGCLRSIYFDFDSIIQPVDKLPKILCRLMI